MAKKKILKEGEILRGRKFRFYPDFDQRAKIDGTLEACRIVQNNYIILNQEREKAEEEKKNRPLVLVINSSSEKLNEIKELLGDRYKGVFVKNDEQARKFLARHKVEFIIRGNEE
jgi:hypothetical protein